MSASTSNGVQHSGALPTGLLKDYTNRAQGHSSSPWSHRSDQTDAVEKILRSCRAFKQSHRALCFSSRGVCLLRHMKQGFLHSKRLQMRIPAVCKCRGAALSHADRRLAPSHCCCVAESNEREFLTPYLFRRFTRNSFCLSVAGRLGVLGAT